MPRRLGRENWVQAAITGALEVYCSTGGRPQFRQFPPFANQQGDRMRQYCGDLIGMLDNAQTILLEIKERECQDNILKEFDEVQFDYNVRFEDLGVPIAYAYNQVPNLEYNKLPRASNWPENTLSQIKRATPRELPGTRPSILDHETLLDWLENDSAGDITDLIGRMQGAIRCPGDPRNGVLVLLYGVSDNALTTLTPSQLLEVVNCVSNNSTLNQRHFLKLQRILGAESAVFNAFSASRPIPTALAPDPDDAPSNDSDGPSP